MNTNMKTLRVTMNNNSDARALKVPGVSPRQCRHNGGKLVIVTVDASEVETISAALDASYAVANYEVQS